MIPVEALGVAFIDGDNVLFVRRTLGRSYSKGRWGLLQGDIPVGRTPGDIAISDAWKKLHIRVLTIVPKGHVLITRGVDRPIRRYCFVCVGDYSDIQLDPEKFDDFKWLDTYRKVRRLKLCPGTEQLLQAMGPILR